MRRALALAIVFALNVAPVSAWAAQGPYDHVWQAEGAVGGDRGGSSSKNVSRDALRIRLADGVFTGRLSYADVLDVRAENGTGLKQEASIEATLTGEPASGGKQAAGTFEGLARIERAAGEDIYEVSGHWGADLSDGMAKGELLYERATLVQPAASSTTPLNASWFNRMGRSERGDPQTFQVEVEGLAAGTQAPSEQPASAGETKTAGGSGAAATGGSGGSEQQPRLGVWAYIRRGLTGAPQRPATPVPLALSKRARALLEAAPPGAVPMPADSLAIDVGEAGGVLDAKNRAAGLLDDRGPAGAARALTGAWQSASFVTPAPSPAAAAAELGRLLKSQATIPGAQELAGDVAVAAQNPQPGQLDTWLAVAQAVAGGNRSVLVETARTTRAVAGTAIPRSGPQADAVLAAALDPRAPREAVRVTAFRRDPSLDATGSPAGGLFPNRVLARVAGSTEGGAPSLSWDSAEGRTSIAPRTWPAYQRMDGAEYWLAGENGPVALTDGTLRGAGFVIGRAYMVDAAQVGRVLAVYDLR